MGVMQVMSHEGDTEIEWNPDDTESVEKAKAEFDRLKDDGFEFFEVAETKGKRVKRFSKKHGKLIAAPGPRKAEDVAAGTRPRASRGGPTALALR